MPETDDHLKEIAEQLYSRNVELAIRNKTLSLLRELYQISILTLEPEELALRIAVTVQNTLEFELFGILMYNEKERSLVPLGFSLSSKFSDSQRAKSCSIENLNIPNVEKVPVISEIIEDKKIKEVSHIKDVWGSLVPGCDFDSLESNANVKSTLVLPLTVRDQMLGVIALCLNREYTELSQFERESIFNFVNIIAVALDKAILYREIQIANARLRELDKQKSEFVSIASHQLRTPLTAMKGYSSMILESTFGKVPEKMQEPVRRIFESSERLVLIIEDFLNISRIEQGRMKYDFSTVNLSQTVDDVLKDLDATFKRKGLTYKKEEVDRGPYDITADKGKVYQVVSNVIDNSIKYTPKGGVTISLRKDDVSHKILLTISDTGIGIPAEVIPQLFQKFSRAEDAGKQNIQGTGLGLYVAKEIMNAHRGNIWVDSDGKDKGSTFHLEFMAE